VRGKTHEEIYEGAHVIVIDEIPYLVNKSSLVSKIGELVVDKKIEGINDIRDESNRDRIRIAIYLKKGVDPEAILMQIYKFTDLQTNFNLNNVSLIEKGTQPRLLNIKDLLMEFVTFRRDVVYRRSVFQLNKAKDRLHILEGLKKAIDIIDEVIDTIKNSESKNDARQNLMDKFGFSEKQAEYILLMRLQSLVGLEIQKISDEIDEKIKVIEYLEAIISDPEKLDQVVAEEFDYMKKKHGDERRTELSNDLSVYNISGSLKEFQKAADRLKEDVICWIGNDFSLRVLYQTRIQNIPDETLDLIYTHNQDQLVVITDQGELVVQRLKDFGQFTMAKQSLDIKQHFSLKGRIVFAKTLHFHYDYLVFLTNQNSIKKIKKELVLSFKKFPTTIMGLEKGEKILKVLPVSD
jgi:DNA gyrase, A subunit